MRRLPVIILLIPIGYVAGYFAGVSYACSGPEAGNLCGLVGVFITGPLGVLAGVLIGLKLGKT